jgi:hypothetical protein
MISFENFRRSQNFKKSSNKSFKGFLDTTFMEKNFLDFARNQFFDSFFDFPLRTFCLKTSLFHQIHPPKFYFSGPTIHKLTIKTNIGKITCILVFFRSCGQKLYFLYGLFFFKNSSTNLNIHQI